MKRAVYLLLFSSFCVYFYFSISSNSSIPSLPLKEQASLEEYFIRRNKNDQKKQKVLIYAATKNGGAIMGQQNLWQCSQEVKDYCTISSNISDRPYADAVYYHNRDFRRSHLVTGYRNPYQVHVASTWESPSNEKLIYPPNYINWTMTYRKDSDIWNPYNRLIQRNFNVSIDLEALWSMKNPNLTATWIASNCKTKNGRQALIQKAAKYDQGIRIFGRCGTEELPNCGRYSPRIYDCAGEVAKQYYFYFAFENSNCQDYVTEKFYNALKWNTVPVVIKRKIYTDLEIPGDMFIALDDFDTVEGLVAFLVMLKKDKKRYLSYHEWRQRLEISQLGDDLGFCALCQKLRNPIQERKWYPNVGSWFSATCDNDYALHYL